MNARTFLAASLLDRSAQRRAIALAMGAQEALAAAESAREPADAGVLFFAKGEATSEQFIRNVAPAPRAKRDPAPTVLFAKGEATADQFVPTPAQARIEVTPAKESTFEASLAPVAPRRPRLSLRVVPEQRLRVKLAAAALGQTSQSFLRDAVGRFLADPRAGEAGELPRHPSLWLQQRNLPRMPRVKLAISVDAERHDEMRRLAARLGRTIQSCLTEALLQHLSEITPLIAQRSAAARVLVVAETPAARPLFDRDPALLRAAG